MSSEDFHRKLTAILSADVVGYSRLMGDDEGATVKTLETYKGVMFSLIKQHRGRVVDSTGDNLLAEFGSVVDAVQCAVSIQKKLQMHNADIPENRRMEFRIGINLGDVIEEDERIYGDGVNIAARIEGLAEPGGICISRNVYDQVKTKLDLGYEYLGEHEAKNIDEPVRIYSVLMDSESAGKIIGEKRFFGRVSSRTTMTSLRLLRPIGLLFAVLLFVVVIAPTTWWILDNYFRTPQEVLAFKERDWILLADFENLTGDNVFDQSLQTAVTVGIEQSQYVNVFPPARIQEALQRMKRENAAELDEELACELAVREGIKAVMACSIGEIGGVYSLTARLVEPNKRYTVLSEIATAEEKKQVLPVLDLLLRIVRQGLGESMQSISSQDVSLPKATTASLEALKTYADGLRAPDTETSIELLELALEIDPDFALAHAEIGIHYYLQNERIKGEEHFKMALSLIDRLTTREKLWIEATVEDWRGHSNQAIECYKIYLSQYPDDSPGWYRLGWIYMARVSQYEKGLEAFEKGAEINPSNSGYYLNMATCYLGLSKYMKAVEYYEKGFELSQDAITGEYVNHEYGFTLVRLGQIQKAKEVFSLMFTSDEVSKRARGYRSTALLAMYQGRLSEAVSNLKQAIQINQSGGWSTSEFRDRMYLAVIYRLQGRTSDFMSQLNMAESMLLEYEFAPSWISILAKIYARTGKVEEASKLYAETVLQVENVTALSGIDRSSQGDQMAISLIKGEIDMAKGNIVEAIESFESSLHWQTRNTNLIESLAMAYRRAGRLKEAAEKYEDIISQFDLGTEAQAIWIVAHFELANIYRDLGDVEKAREFYDKLLNIWRSPDHDIPILQDTRTEYTKLY